jgi:hypothetical protein
VTRVLIGGFGAIVAVGLRDLLEERGCEVVSERATSGLVDHLVDGSLEAVVLELDRGGDEIAEAMSSMFPGVKVVAFSSERPVMRIFRSCHCGDPRGGPLTVDRLFAAISPTGNPDQRGEQP